MSNKYKTQIQNFDQEQKFLVSKILDECAKQNQNNKGSRSNGVMARNYMKELMKSLKKLRSDSIEHFRFQQLMKDNDIEIEIKSN